MLDCQKLLFVHSDYVIYAVTHRFDVHSVYLFLLSLLICLTVVILAHHLIFPFLLSTIVVPSLTPTVSQLQCQSCADSRILVQEPFDSLVVPADLNNAL